VVTKVYKVIKYERSKPFEWFMIEVTEARREGDKDAESLLIGETFKLLGNSGYGKFLENVEGHHLTRYTSKECEVENAHRSPWFQDLEEIGDSYEITSTKPRVKIDRPYQCGIAVYQLAKLRMLQFYYDFLDVYVDRADFEMIQMDTDSNYIAISGQSFEDVIKDDKRAQFMKVKGNWFPHANCKCGCIRTPGLFKVECEGTRAIALSSKCYYIDGCSKENKYSCKGINREQNEITGKRFWEPLFTEKKDTCSDIGFRQKSHSVHAYTQKKVGLYPIDYKRYEDDDGIHTAPLMK